MPAPGASLPGIHHVTAITADAQKNIDFYCGLLGLRLVKLTVNFDDPASYHLYYGDELGRPGTILTFFVWPDAQPGRVGRPQVTAISLAVPPGPLDFWQDRLSRGGITSPTAITRFGHQLLSFTDPDGIPLEIVPTDIPAAPASAPTPHHSVPPGHAIRAIHGITISEEGHAETATLLTDLMHFKLESTDGNRFRYRSTAADAFASIVDLLCVPEAPRGRIGPGTIHHVAFRTPDDAQQERWRQQLIRSSFNVSPIIDRSYFHSIYFREPGGILFEIATDSPGFALDEPPETLGTALMLPAHLEPHRPHLQRILPPVRLPRADAASPPC